jgi:hypothetical protein
MSKQFGFAESSDHVYLINTELSFRSGSRTAPRMKRRRESLGESVVLPLQGVLRPPFRSQRKTITAAGVSAGIDRALELVALTHGEEMAKMVQVVIEYDPLPPFEGGPPRKATAERVNDARQ